MIIESVPLINYLFKSQFLPIFLLYLNLQLEPMISGYIMIIDLKNLANVPFVITPKPLKLRLRSELTLTSKSF